MFEAVRITVIRREGIKVDIITDDDTVYSKSVYGKAYKKMNVWKEGVN
jgi:hypothetical protein